MANFDPSEHNVDEVKAHLEANPDDWDAVMEAEAAGKNRSSITSMERSDEEAASDDADDTGAAPDVNDLEGRRAEARRQTLRDPQLVQAEAAKLLNQGKGQEPFKRQDGKDVTDVEDDA